MSRLCRVVVVVSAFGACLVGCGNETAEGEVGPTESFVCGTDGKTYSVEQAGTGGHEIAHRGRCEEPMRCDSPEDCFVGDACASDVDAPWCVPGQTRCNCPGVFEPVCGGDGRNYINACEAACAGVGIQHDGYCEEPRRRGGCERAGCSSHLCVEEGSGGGSTCEWLPVYACYQQATCERQEDGLCGFTPTDELVECIEQNVEGTCRENDECPPGFSCQDDIYGAPSPVGVCQPCICLDIYDPVCGADGQTWGNGCEAGCNRVEILYEGECNHECPAETHIRDSRGECVPKCYGPEQCTDGQSCNAADVCRQDPACPECDVCVGWCVTEEADCREAGCAPGFTCEHCRTADGGAEWTCLSPDAGICEPPDTCRVTGCNGEICADQDVASPCVALPEFACYDEHGECELQPWGECDWTRTPELDECLAEFDCRATGCADGDYCTFCWTDWACIPEGIAC